MKNAIMPKCAGLLSGIKLHIPAASRDQAMLGKVKSSKVRRPKVSMVQIAGQAKTKLTRPKPKEAMRASASLAPARRKTVEE